MSRRPTSLASLEGQPGHSESDFYADEENRETPDSLKSRQTKMEDKVYRIWTCVSILSSFTQVTC